jgi:hypothetical protein
MKYVAILLMSLVASCGQLPSVNWPTLVECAPDISDAVGVVGRILLEDGDDSTIGQRGKRGLADLAAREGPKTVACLIERLVSDWTAVGAAQDPLLIHGAERGEKFLREVGTTVDLQDEQW